MNIAGRPLYAGVTAGPVVALDEPVSFWGGFDPATGRIIDKAHPQCGSRLTGAIVLMPGSRGSSGTPGVLGEALRRGTGPAALILTKADINLVAGATVAESLYTCSCPVILVDAPSFSKLRQVSKASISEDGSITADD